MNDIGIPWNSLFPSITIQNPPTDLAVAVPLAFIGGLPGSMCISNSVSHSPTICLSHSCSLVGGGSFGGSWADNAANPLIDTTTIADRTDFSMALSEKESGDGRTLTGQASGPMFVVRRS